MNEQERIRKPVGKEPRLIPETPKDRRPRFPTKERRTTLHARAVRVSRSDAPLEDSRKLGYSFAMATTVEQLAEQAMILPIESRARLADLLVESLDADELGHIDRLWVTEAKHRRDEVRSGRVEAVPGEEALQKVRDAVRR